MFRALPLFALCAFLVACGPESGQSTPTEPEKKPAKTGKADQPSAMPVTGTPMYQRDTEAIAKELRELEKQGRPADAAKLATYERNVRMKIQHIDVTLQALEVSIAAESKEIVEKSHKALLQRRTTIDKKVDGMWREITEIRDMLKAAAKGTDEIPAGFTEDELKDRMGDLEESVRSLREQRAELNKELDELIAALRGDKSIPDQGATTLTQERDVLRELRKRAEKLLEG